MSARYDIAALGELLIDFTDSGVSPGGMRLFERNPGGAPANVLTAAARFGQRTAFLGKVGDDMHGQFLRQMLLDAGIDVSGLVLAEDVAVSLYSMMYLLETEVTNIITIIEGIRYQKDISYIENLLVIQ